MKNEKDKWSAEKRALWSVWEQIADDVLAVEQEMGNKTASQALVIEMVLDADRPTTLRPDFCWANFYNDLTYEERKEVAKEVFYEVEYSL